MIVLEGEGRGDVPLAGDLSQDWGPHLGGTSRSLYKDSSIECDLVLLRGLLGESRVQYSAGCSGTEEGQLTEGQF